MFRFSRAPENLHYFPLSEPSRLVIDVTGPIEALPQVATYKVDDPQIEAVRVSGSAGRMRLIVDLALDEPPPFSVDTNAAILTVRIGRKNKTTSSAHTDAQILFIAENADLRQLAQTPALSRVDGPFSSEAQEEPAFPAPESLPLAPDAAPAEASLRETASSQPPYDGQKISLHFKDADIRDILRILADVSGLNIVATDDVTGRVTLRLVDVPWDQALAVVLHANGLERVRSGNIVTISTAARLEAERHAQRKAQETERHRAPLETVYVKVNYVKATDIASLIGRQAEPRDSAVGAPGSHTRRDQGEGPQIALMSSRGTIVADGTSNVVIIRDVQANIAAVRELIRNIDIQTPQVLIESYIVTASENINRSLGIQWGYQYAAGPETGKPTGLNFPGRIGIGGAGSAGTGGIPFIANFPALAGASTLDLFLGSLDGTHSLNTRLSALESEGKARVVSRPRVVTLNNGEALITSRREVRVPVTSGNLTVGGAGTSGGGEAFEEFDVGITLRVTPQISSDGFVLLDIEAESSELAASSVTTTANSSTVPRIPDVLSRTTNSQVLIRAGATFVLGGILQDNLDRQESGIPYLRHAPGIGWLFRGKAGRRTKDELLIFLTPKIVAGVSTAGLPAARQLWGNRATGVARP